MGKGAKINFRLTFPAPASRGNARENHWRRYSNMKKYEKIVSGYLMEQWGRLPKEARDTPWPKFTWKMHVEMRNLADFDNLMAMAKYPLDCLKKMRIITDDGPKYAVPSDLPTQEVLRISERKLYLDISFESKA